MQVTRTYLELKSPGEFRPAFGEFPDVTVERVAQPTAELYRHCYRTVGKDFHWRDRWDWTDAELRAHLAQSEISIHVAKRGGALVGWYELRRVPEENSVEIAYFGVFPDAIGRGLGKHLLSCAVRDAWATGPTRVWLHTCTLDHPAALPNYLARGFQTYKTEIYEVDE
ncbi:MAG: GNAT family N-acetyltransferase [Gemmatimonadetes bacterium]|nr:GNAT family N-acetyltransferase [Gemmatimonadota bacterium]